MKVRTSIAIDEEVLKELNTFDRNTVKSISSLINDLLKKFIEEKKKE
ncbi:unnamed protein product [marine sediment metagenome]|uniref:Uncharacterized protein n=1 Tax=marine sediment metagenome TaxID=412755 RepID=X1BFI5_9ZZZZ